MKPSARGESRDRAGALADGIGDGTPLPLRQRDHDELGPAEFGGDAHRHSRLELRLAARRQPGHAPQDRRDDVVEGEHRRGREAGQDDHGLAAADREAEGLAGLQRDPVGDDPRRSQPRHEAVGEVAGALRGAARQDDHVAFGVGSADRRVERRLVVRDGAVEDGLAAVLGHRGADDRAVGVVDRRRRQRPARRDQLVAGREHADARTAEHRDGGEAAGGEHADLARADDGAAPQQGLASRDVRAGEADELAGRRRAPHRNARLRRILIRVRLLDHDDRVGAARDRRAGGDGRRRARSDDTGRGDAAGDDLVVQPQGNGRGFARRGDIRRAHRETVDGRAVEGRHVAGRSHVFGENTAQRLGKLGPLGPDRRRAQGALEAAHRLLARQHRQELFLGEGVAKRRVRPVHRPLLQQKGGDRVTPRETLAVRGERRARPRPRPSSPGSDRRRPGARASRPGNEAEPGPPCRSADTTLRVSGADT